MLCLVTPNWLASSMCFNEFRAAWFMGKRIIPLYLLPDTDTLGDEARRRLSEVCVEDQGVDLLSARLADGALNIDTNETLTETGLKTVEGALEAEGHRLREAARSGARSSNG